MFIQYRHLLWLAALMLFSLFPLPLLHAKPASLITIELQNADLTEAIAILAKELKINVIVSRAVEGTVSVALHDAEVSRALDMLLTTHGLAKEQIGNVFFIAPKAEMIKRQEEQLKWQEVSNKAAILITKAWKIKFAKAADIAQLFKDEHTMFLTNRGQVRVDPRTNTLFIQDTQERITLAQQMLHTLDVPVQQIVIEVRLASIDHDYERELGINFSSLQPSSDNSSDTIKAISPTKGPYSLAIAKLADRSLLDVKLSALENAGRAELISSPRLFAVNQQPASIEAGEEVPYQEVTVSGGTAVVFKKAVLGLKVTPQILPGNKVLLQMQINQDRPSNKMVLGMPTITTRQIMTNVLIKNGQTIILGGIFETNRETGQQRLPFISQLPVLGLLFTQQNTRENKRELLIFVTPKIITQPL